MRHLVLADLLTNPLLILGGGLLAAVGASALLVGGVRILRPCADERRDRQSFSLATLGSLLFCPGYICLQMAWLAGAFD